MELIPSFPKDFLSTGFARFIREDSEIIWKFKKEYLDARLEPEKERIFYSPEFPKDSNAEFKWKAALYFSIPSWGEADYSSIYVKPTFKVNVPINLAFCFALQKCLRWCPIKKLNPCILNNQEEIGFFKFMKISELQSYVNGGYLSIWMKVSAYYDSNANYRSNFSSQRTLLRHYSSISNSGAFSDLIICAKEDGTQFKVHRTVLAARSKVFAGMFSHNLKENQMGQMEIKDLSSSVIKKLLDFIYSCKVEFESVPAIISLMEAAEKYDLVDLKLQCVEYLSTAINKDNACSILKAASTFNITNLKEDVLNYMNKNREKFTDPKIFEELSSEVIAEIAAKFAKRNL